MDELVEALGLSSRNSSGIWVVMLFVSTTCCFVLVGEVAVAGGLAEPLLQIVAWALWFTWQGWLFPRGCEARLRLGPETAYRASFYRHIVPGVSFGVAQMIRPVVSGDMIGGPVSLDGAAAMIGFPLLLLGIILLQRGFDCIGIAGAGFLYEFRDMFAPVVRTGVYAHIRHPLFLGGVLASVGATLAIGGSASAVPALTNLLVLPIYGYLEDRRLERVLGPTYRQYEAEVAQFLPRGAATWVVRRCGLLRQ